MEYMTMLEAPGMVGGLVELIDDNDPFVVKRTIRVFTNVYRHSLALLADGSLDPKKYTSSYEEINSVSNKLIIMLQTTDNEGIVIHLVRYLEAAIVSHILSDLSKYPDIAEMTAPMLRKGVNSLLEFVKMPHVNGTSFCVAIRALITVACHQPSIKPIIVDLSEKLLSSPPPNFFDHHVRSFHKTLQRNIFRLLRRAEEDDEKERLIDLLVKVGIPRRRLNEWAPRKPNRKRPGYFVDGRHSPTNTKKMKPTAEEIIRFSPPLKIRSGTPPLHVAQPKLIPLEPTKKSVLQSKSTTDSSTVTNSTATSTSSETSGTSNTSKAASMLDFILSSRSPQNSFETRLSQSKNRKLLSILFPKKNDDAKTNTGESTARTSGHDSADCESKTSDDDDHKKAVGLLDNFIDRCSSKEKYIFNKLNLETVCDILLESTLRMPTEKPDYIPTLHLDTEDRLKEKLVVLLALYIPDKDLEMVSENKLFMGNTAKNSTSYSEIKKSTVNSDIESFSTSDGENKESFKDVVKPFNFDVKSENGDVDLRLLLKPRDPRLGNKPTTVDSISHTVFNSSVQPIAPAGMLSTGVCSNDPRLSKSLLFNVNRGVDSSNSDPRLNKTTQEMVTPRVASPETSSGGRFSPPYLGPCTNITSTFNPYLSTFPKSTESPLANSDINGTSSFTNNSQMFLQPRSMNTYSTGSSNFNNGYPNVNEPINHSYAAQTNIPRPFNEMQYPRPPRFDTRDPRANNGARRHPLLPRPNGPTAWNGRHSMRL